METERITCTDLAGLQHRTFAGLTIMILLRHPA
jgi:hypothetical protein